MPLQFQTVDVPLTSGLRQDQDDAAVEPGSFLVLRNVEMERSGAVIKRPGYTALPITTTEELLDLPAVNHLDTLGGELLAIGNRPQTSVATDPQEPGPYLWSYSSAQQRWSSRSSVGPMTLRRRTALRSSIPLVDAQPFVSVANGIEVLVWRAPAADPRAEAPVFVRARDVATGAIVIDDTEIEGVAGRFVSFACGSQVLVVWHDGATNFLEVAIDCSTLEIGAPYAGVLYTEPDEWDACPVNSTTYAIVATITGQTIGRTVQVGVGQIDDAILVASLVELPTCTSDGTWISVAWVDSVGVKAARYLTDMSTDIPPALLIFPTNPGAPDVFDRLSVALDSSGTTWVAADARRWITVGVSSLEGLWTGCLLNDGGIVLPNRFSYHLSQISRPWTLGGRTYILCGPSTYNNDPTDTALALSTQFGAVVLCLSQHAMIEDAEVDAGFVANNSRLHHVAAALPASDVVHVFGLEQSLKKEPLPFVAPLPGALAFVVPLELYAGQGFEARSYDLLDVSFEYGAALWRSAAAQGALVQTGGLTGWYDGYSVTELGFIQRPRWYGLPERTTGDADPGTRSYLYCAIYAWRDGRGNLHLSEPSDPQTVTLTDQKIGPGGDATVTLRVKTTHSTRKGDTADGVNRLVMVWLYRTLANAPEAYYLLDTIDLTNKIDSYSVEFFDHESDEELQKAARGILYTAAGVLENRPPPASLAVLQHKNRVWLVSANDDREVWFSKVLVAGEGPGFHEALRLRIDDSPEGITGLAALDDKTIVFTRSRIYAVTGDGPNDLGADGAFGGPFLVTASAGCLDARSVVSWQGGVLFRSAEGLCNLDRNLQVSFIGAPVRSLTDVYTTTIGGLLDAARRRVMWLCQRPSGQTLAVVFDYEHGAWYNWAFESPDGSELRQQAHTLWRGTHVRSHDDTGDAGLVLQQSTTAGLDDGVWVSFKVRTPYLHPSAFGGAQRVRKLVFSGERLNARELTVRTYLDLSEDPADEHAIPSTLFGLGGQNRFSVHLAHQKCSSMAIELSDSAPTPLPSSNPRARLYGLALELGVKPGTAKFSTPKRRLHLASPPPRHRRRHGCRGPHRRRCVRRHGHRATRGRPPGRPHQVPVGRLS